MSMTIDIAKNKLVDLLNKNKLCIFAGSGISVSEPTRLPTWDGFVNDYINICAELNKYANLGENFDQIIADAQRYKEKDVVSTVTALKDFVNKYKKKNNSTTLYDQRLVSMFLNKEYNKNHEAIVSTNFKYILTTNYDILLEIAASMTNHTCLALKSYTYNDLDKISEAIYTDDSAIIHIHGVATKIVLEEFVLTKEDYKRIKDKNPGFRTLMNTLFMSYSILFAGYGGSDPHLEDIIEDINMTLKWQNNPHELDLPIYYLIMKKDKISPILKHIKNSNRTKIIPVEDYDESLELLQYLQKACPRVIEQNG